jgi:hypothetical protein
MSNRRRELVVQPVEGLSRFVTTFVLDRRPYRFAFYTNTFDDSWYFDIVDVLHGVGLSSGVNLLYPYRYLGAAIPPGPLWIKDKGLKGRHPRIEDFERGLCALYYDEVESE